MKVAKFTRGRNVYKCAICERPTRDTGENADHDLCPQCYDLSGLQNMKWDGCYDADDDKQRDSLFAALAKLGGSTGKVKVHFHGLWE